MKKSCFIVISALLLFLSSCYGISHEPYDDSSGMAQELEIANQKITSLRNDLAKVESDLNGAKEEIQRLNDENSKLKTASEELQALKDEYTIYKSKMAPYENLSQAEAEARMIEADRIRKEAEAEKLRRQEEEKLAAEEAARKLEEEAKLGYETGITYEQIARNPDDYKGQKVKFTGQVLQVVEDSKENQLRLSVHMNSYGWYDSEQVIYCGYDPSLLNFRILDNDIITIYGTSVGVISYKSITGTTITLPAVYVDKIELN